MIKKEKIEVKYFDGDRNIHNKLCAIKYSYSHLDDSMLSPYMNGSERRAEIERLGLKPYDKYVNVLGFFDENESVIYVVGGGTIKIDDYNKLVEAKIIDAEKIFEQYLY